MLTRHFQDRLDAEADRLWDEGILDHQKLDEIRQMDLHAKSPRSIYHDLWISLLDGRNTLCVSIEILEEYEDN